MRINSNCLSVDYKNPLTNALSCPPGFTSATYGTVMDANGCEVNQVTCWRDGATFFPTSLMSTDEDECSDGNNYCTPESSCTNVNIGGYTCSCLNPPCESNTFEFSLNSTGTWFSDIPIIVVDLQGGYIVDEPKSRAFLYIMGNSSTPNISLSERSIYENYTIGIELRGKSSQSLVCFIEVLFID